MNNILLKETIDIILESNLDNETKSKLILNFTKLVMESEKNNFTYIPNTQPYTIPYYTIEWNCGDYYEGRTSDGNFRPRNTV